MPPQQATETKADISSKVGTNCDDMVEIDNMWRMSRE